MSEPHKRYLVFMYDRYYPDGGLSEVKTSFEKLDEAREYAQKKEHDDGDGFGVGIYDYSQIYDRTDGREVIE